MARPAGKHTEPRIVHHDPDARVEVREGKKCTCPEWPFCSWLDCRSDCPACPDDAVLLDLEREARWADTGQGEAPVDRKLHGNHTKDPSRVREERAS